MSFLKNIEWRYATKSFDTNKKVSDVDLSTITEAIRMTPTSFGLQPYHFYIVTNQEIKDKIQAAAWNQPQVGTSSHLIIFAARNDIKENTNEYFDLISGGNVEVRASLKGYEDMVSGFADRAIAGGFVSTWAAKQTYIAQGFAMAALAELQIDSCPMEGFDPAAVGTILGLPENLTVSLLLPIGYRNEGDGPRTPHKVRFSKEVLFTTIL
jgi:nitroreductase